MTDPRANKAQAEYEKLVTMYVNQKLKHDKAEEDNRKSNNYSLRQSDSTLGTRRRKRSRPRTSSRVSKASAR
jgi:hypothetical protein